MQEGEKNNRGENCSPIMGKWFCLYHSLDGLEVVAIDLIQHFGIFENSANPSADKNWQPYPRGLRKKRMLLYITPMKFLQEGWKLKERLMVPSVEQ